MSSVNEKTTPFDKIPYFPECCDFVLTKNDIMVLHFVFTFTMGALDGMSQHFPDEKKETYFLINSNLGKIYNNLVYSLKVSMSDKEK